MIRCNLCDELASVYRVVISKMFLRSHSPGFRTTGFFKSYFILGILSLFFVFFLYFNWVTRRLEQETAEFSMMLANFAARISSIADKETSDAAKAIIDNFKFPFVVTDASGHPIVARGISNDLREKIRDKTLTREEKLRLLELVTKMDRDHSPIPMKGADEGRKIVGYIYYDEIEWSLSKESSLVLTDVAEEPLFWRNIGTVGMESGNTHGIARANITQVEIQSFIENSKKKRFFNVIQYNPLSEDAYFHYGNSGIIHQLRWWMPLTQMTMVAIFLVIGLIGYQRIKYNEQQAIWAGLAKETAHQLGTPISSLMGWLEVLNERGSFQERNGNAEDGKPVSLELSSIFEDMQNDVLRLKDITARFGEVGSMPKRELLDVRDTVHEAVVYFQRRLPRRQKHVEIVEDHQDVPEVYANEILLQWVIENLIRNSLDAIDRDDGKIEIKTEFDPKKKNVVIIYKDNGKGIPRKSRRRIFLPGYTSKKHGWGLGLAIVKRIIEGYHEGSVKLAESGSKGSTFVITLPARSSIDS